MAAGASFRKAAVIFNPASGTRQRRRLRDVQKVISTLREAGVEANAIPTTGPGQAHVAVKEALSRGADAILSCGGDGTLNEVLQGLMTAGTGVPVGVVPFGAGNVFAKEIGIPLDPARAAVALLHAKPRPVAVGMLDALSTSGEPLERYWMVATGIGVDARAICRIRANTKARFGIWGYYAESIRQLLSSDPGFTPFVAEFEEAGSGRRRQEFVTQIIASRVGYFAGHLRTDASGEPGPDEFELVLFKSQRRSTYVSYGTRLLLRKWHSGGGIRDVEVVKAREALCRAVGSADASPAGWSSSPESVLVEADGEFIGTVAARLSMARRTVSVLFPQR